MGKQTEKRKIEMQEGINEKESKMKRRKRKTQIFDLMDRNVELFLYYLDITNDV